MRTIWVVICLFLASARIALAAGPYTYTLFVGPFYVTPSGPQLNSFQMTWQSSTLLNPAVSTCVNLQPETGFRLVGAPLHGWVVRALVPSAQFCYSAPDLYTVTVVLDSPSVSQSELDDSFYFTGKPPVTTGSFTNSSAATSIADGKTAAVLGTGATATLIITDMSMIVSYQPVPAWLTALLRTSLEIAGPVTPPAGSPVEGLAGFIDFDGKLIGQMVPVTVTPGELTSVDWPATEFVQNAGAHKDLIPVLSFPPGPEASELELTTEVFDNQTNSGAVLIPPLNANSLPSALAPQGLAAGQTIRLIVTAGAGDQCAATLSFADKTGHPIGKTLQVNLMPGQSKALDLNSSSSLQAGQFKEVQPLVSLGNDSSVCLATSEVYSQATGSTSTYQNAEIQLH